MIFKLPPQFGQWSMSISKTRLSSLAQLMRADAVTLEPFVGDRRPGDIAAQVLQLLALIGAPAHCRMKSEAVEFGTQARGGWPVCARQALQAQHLLSRSSPERKAVGARGRLQGQKRVFPIRFGEVGHALLFDEKPKTGQQPHDARDDLGK